MKHDLSGSCPECEVIFNAYPQFNEELKTWFKAIQIEHPDAHISSAGRGKIQQETYFQRGATKAHYGQSSHNYNAAIDIFQLKEGSAVWDQIWFDQVIAPNLYDNLNWYGAPKSVFRELPHVELKRWKDMVSEKLLTLVE